MNINTSKFKTQRGVSLIELMVSILIATFIIAGVVQLYATSTQNSIGFEGAARIQENARYAFARLESDLSLAGSGPCFNLVDGKANNRFVSKLTLTAGAKEKFDFTRGFGGIEGGTDSDTLYVRYANHKTRIPVVSWSGDDDPTAESMVLDKTDDDFGDLEQYQVVYASDCERAAVFMITNVNSGTGTIQLHSGVTAPASHVNNGQANSATIKTGLKDFAGLFTGDANKLAPGKSLAYVYGKTSFAEYRIGNSAAGTCSATNPQFCALLRNNEEIVEGVESMQVEYGWENTAGTVNYHTWAQITAATPEDATLLIDRVKVTLVLNSIDRAPTLDGNNYLKKTMSRVFVVRNQLPVDKW